MADQVVWVDIPVADLERAVRFYSAVLGAPLAMHEMQGMKLAFLPAESGEVGGCLFKSKTDKPGRNGPLMYLNCNGRLDAAEAQVEKHGGKVLKPAHSIAPHGSRAIILDSEGNRIALHSR
ncbi:MAG TPA: VOC family protein [Hyphomicrobiaceae bacterium]|nr:VOC family protein [Hyphomicrobiaceae bacterium]